MGDVDNAWRNVLYELPSMQCDFLIEGHGQALLFDVLVTFVVVYGFFDDRALLAEYKPSPLSHCQVLARADSFDDLTLVVCVERSTE